MSDSYTDYADSISSEADYTPFPSLTVSQRVRLNEIIHREPIGYASSFDNIELVEPVEECVEEHARALCGKAEHVEHAQARLAEARHHEVLRASHQLTLCDAKQSLTGRSPEVEHHEHGCCCIV